MLESGQRPSHAPASGTHATRSQTHPSNVHEADPVWRYPLMHDGFGGHTPGLAGQLLQPLTANARLTHASSHRRALSFIGVQRAGILLAVGITICRSAATAGC